MWIPARMLCPYASVYVCVCMCVYVCVYVCVCMCGCVYVGACACMCVCIYPVNTVCICASTISQMSVSEPDQISEYGTGLINVHEEHMMFSVGLWFVISIDSAILSSAMSLQVWSIEIESVLFDFVTGMAIHEVFSKRCVFVLFLVSRRCSMKRTLKKTYTPKGVLFGSVEISTKLCPGVNV